MLRIGIERVREGAMGVVEGRWVRIRSVVERRRVRGKWRARGKLRGRRRRRIAGEGMVEGGVVAVVVRGLRRVETSVRCMYVPAADFRGGVETEAWQEELMVGRECWKYELWAALGNILGGARRW